MATDITDLTWHLLRVTLILRLGNRGFDHWPALGRGPHHQGNADEAPRGVGVFEEPGESRWAVANLAQSLPSQLANHDSGFGAWH